MPQPHRRGFTLVELLVVVTIIVVLLSLLAPAMDRAIREAELAVCGTHVKQIALGVSAYAVKYRQQYPPTISTGQEPLYLVLDLNGPGPRVSHYLKDFLTPRVFACPLAPALRAELWEDPQVTILNGHYSMFWNFDNLAGWSPPTRLGNAGEGVLATDMFGYPTNDVSGYGPGYGAARWQTTHPLNGSVTYRAVGPPTEGSCWWWFAPSDPIPDEVSFNVGYVDNSVVSTRATACAPVFLKNVPTFFELLP